MALKHLGWRAGLFALSLANSEAIANVNHDNVPQYLHIQEVTLDKALQHVAERFAYAYVANPKLLSHSDTVSLNGNYGLGSRGLSRSFLGPQPGGIEMGTVSLREG